MNPFQQFEEKFGKGESYNSASQKLLYELDKILLPSYYIKDLEKNGFRKFLNGFWWYVNPLENNDDLEAFTKNEKSYTIIRNAFGSQIVYFDNKYFHLDIHRRQLGLLSDKLDLIINFTLTDDFALRDMFYWFYFDDAITKCGEVEYNEIYTFVPALALGGETKKENIQIVKYAEQLHFLSQL